MFGFKFKTGIRAQYDVLDHPSFVSEPWLVFPGKKTNATTGPASVFIFDKTKFESQLKSMGSYSSMSKNPKVIISESYELIKHEISQLAKLRHPQILAVYKALEETKTKFLFASEPVSNNLLSVNLTKDFDEITIQKGLLEIAKGLQFLHNNCSTIHFNIQPSSVYINNQGDWKLGGFKFLQNLNEISPLDRDNFYIMNTSVVPFANPNLNYIAPELILDSLNKLSFANDVFSLGLLIYYLYNQGENLLNCFDSSSVTEYKAEFQKFSNKFYNHRANELRYVLKNTPEKIYPLLIQMLARYPHDRITIDQFVDSDFFDGSVIKAMFFVDELSTKTVEEKVIFIKGLLGENNIFPLFPLHFKNNKLLPVLIDLITNELNVLGSKPLDNETNDIIASSLIAVLKIGDGLSGLTFQDKIYTPLFSIPKKREQSNFLNLISTSVKVRLAVLENLPTLDSKLKDTQMVAVAKELPELCLTAVPLDIDSQEDQVKLQDLFLLKTSTMVSKFDFPYIKNSFFPLLCQVFKTTTILSTKLSCIDTFQSLIDDKVIDKIIVNEQLLPLLKNLKSRNKNVVGKVLTLFLKLSESEHISLELEVLVEAVLTQCLSLSFGCNDCSQTEFQDFMKLINQIQTRLTKKKFDSLPQTSSNNTFDSLVNTQALTHGNKEDSVKPIKSVPMQPTVRKTSSESFRKPVLGLNLRHKSEPKSPLNFGATSSNGNNAHPGLVGKLNNIQINKDDDEFEEFQAVDPGISWTSEVNKTKKLSELAQERKTQPLRQNPTTRPNTQPLRPNNSTRPNTQPLRPINATRPNSIQPLQPNNASLSPNFPPGFNSSVVLTPSAGNHTKPANTAATKNSDLLDFL